jgi:hypothetical protein
MDGIGRVMIFGGLALAAVGLLFVLLGKVTGGAGLPGDIVVQRKNFTFVFPVVTSIVVSVVLTLILNLFFRR